MHEDDTEIHRELSNLSYKIIGLAIDVHRELGPGLLESAYLECLFYEIKNSGFEVKKQLALPILYKDIKLDHGYRIDLLIENTLVVELKTVDAFTDDILHKSLPI